MKTIVLLTDFGNQDHFVGVMKGVIYSITPYVNIIDLCHEIPIGNITKAALVLKNSFKYFPKESVFVVVVDPGVGSDRKKLLIKTDKYYFVGPDNGVFSYTLENSKIIKIIELTNDKYWLKPISNTFHGRDIFSPIAAYIINGINIMNFGNEINSYKRLPFINPEFNKNEILGKIIDIDKFGNLISNISIDFLNKYLKVNKDKYLIEISNKIIYGIKDFYSEVKQGEPIVLVGSTGMLEVSIYMNNASIILDTKINDPIKIKTML